MVTRMSKLMKAIITWAMSQDETRLRRTELVAHLVNGSSEREKHKVSVTVGRALRNLKQHGYVVLYGSDGAEDPVTVKSFELTEIGKRILEKKPCFGVLYDGKDELCKKCKDKKACKKNTQT